MTPRESDAGDQVDPHEEMAQLLLGHWRSQAIRAIAELSIADHLVGGGLTAAEIATRADSAQDSTFRLLRAGIACGLLRADRDGRFFSTPLLETLRRDAPRSLRSMALSFTDVGHWKSWLGFVTAVRTGHADVREVLGMDWFDYLEQHPDQAHQSASAMAALTSLWAGGVGTAIDTTNVKLAVDVGGSTGAFLRMLQESNPTLRGIVFDRPNVAAEVAMRIAHSEVGQRTEVVGGDFFKSLPVGDLYLLKHILHNWDDDRCVQILSCCREAMIPGGRIAIAELIVGSLSEPGVAALMDLRMLVAHGGRERSLQEYDALLGAAGLRRTAVATTGSPLSVIEAVAA
ncbi:methyltransferase [Mycobacterium sp. Aquia_216]|uniref:methyltransferase n=1 Tax=Mycobacterium sp. Aquia_216 TaxID=2991729 RepID=UPI00227A0A66|nr:methyltransferase [Mycobacterium sp. Aquia_216]WAJ42838.1 methyltransferase [Mycobacterium sp. Aquia_216]